MVDVYSDYFTDLFGGMSEWSFSEAQPIPPAPWIIPATWTARVREPDLTLSAPLRFVKMELIERYNLPDTLSIAGDIDDMRPALEPGSGIYVTDDLGDARFSGFATPIQRSGDKTATVTYLGDLQLLWDRVCWPKPTAAWSTVAQDVESDSQTAVHEVRILGFINRNAGSIAYNAGGVNRRIANLRLPTSLGRGTSGVTTARFEKLGQLVADLSEAANLRTRMIFTPEAGGNFLDVKIDDASDLSSWARFGDAYYGGPGLLDESWNYTIGAGASIVLSAAQGEGTARTLNFLQDTTRRDAWSRHVEIFIDQRDDGDASEISEGMATAMAENAPTVEVEAPIAAGNLRFGQAAGAIPVGAKVAVNLDGELLYERIRQITTTVAVSDGEETVKTEPMIGTPDAGLTIEQQRLIGALKRLRTLESR